jgi:hypothetical protein
MSSIMTGRSQPKAVHISQVDTFFANGGYPIEFLFFFSRPIETRRIRSALREIASDFWPVFGSYDRGAIGFEEYVERHHFDEVLVDRDYDPSAPSIEVHREYGDTNPAVDRKLFFLTVIHHRNGTLLIPKMNHIAGDGYSFFYLLSVLAAVTRTPRNVLKRYAIRRRFKPVHQRTVLREFHFPIHDLERPIEPENLQTETIEVPKKEVEASVREAVSGQNRKMSANDLLSAMVVKRVFKKQRTSFEDAFSLTVPIDVRRSVQPYGPSYFGNGLLLHGTPFAAKRLPGMSDHEVAQAIRQSMPKIDRDSYLAYLQGIERWIADGKTELLRPYDPEKGCLVTNLSKMPVSRLDFGSGTPDHVFPLTVGRNSAAVLDDAESYVLRLIY